MSELRALCKKLRESYHEVEEEHTIPNWEDIEQNDGEKIFKLKNLYLGVYVNSKTDKNELYIVEKSGLKSLEIFSNTLLDFNSDATCYREPLISFIPTAILKPHYTESELKVLLEYCRDLYHNNKTMYVGKSLTLETKDDD